MRCITDGYHNCMYARTVEATRLGDQALSIHASDVRTIPAKPGTKNDELSAVTTLAVLPPLATSSELSLGRGIKQFD